MDAILDDCFERLEAGTIQQPVRNIFLCGWKGKDPADLVVWLEDDNYDICRSNQ